MFLSVESIRVSEGLWFFMILFWAFRLTTTQAISIQNTPFIACVVLRRRPLVRPACSCSPTGACRPACVYECTQDALGVWLCYLLWHTLHEITGDPASPTSSTRADAEFRTRLSNPLSACNPEANGCRQHATSRLGRWRNFRHPCLCIGQTSA